ncbi:MAG: hypothetical protein K9J85_10440 [Desulfobacteraceae bacterium]|nr:hypothetical protein [Desulfobacteraceae bacterium]
MIRQKPGPPWDTPQSWRAANKAVSCLLDSHRRWPGPLFETSTMIRDRIEELDFLYRQLCTETCPFCPQPCCITADIWFDLKDLIFLHAEGLPVPANSPQKLRGMPCPFLGFRGCGLPRTTRPWICTWYLCPVQKLRLKKHRKDLLHKINLLTSEVAGLRRQLEQCFIRLGAPVK